MKPLWMIGPAAGGETRLVTIPWGCSYQALVDSLAKTTAPSSLSSEGSAEGGSSRASAHVPRMQT